MEECIITRAIRVPFCHSVGHAFNKKLKPSDVLKLRCMQLNGQMKQPDHQNVEMTS